MLGGKNFDDWLASTSLPAARENAGKMEELGVSHHTFRRPEPEVVEDLIAGGIPRLAAADIVHTAKKFFDEQRERAERPLGVFWDVENVRIPKEMTGDGIARAIKTRLKPFGSLALFNAYFEVSGANMSADKRSGLQLSGCHIIDTPHINRKEVADKMIIVDALLFAMQHAQTGGTLCFITGDTDYAYMMSRLSELKQFRTVLVTQRSTRDVLNLSAHCVLNWSSDIIAPNPGVLLGIQSNPHLHAEQKPTPLSSAASSGGGGGGGAIGQFLNQQQQQQEGGRKRADTGGKMGDRQGSSTPTVMTDPAIMSVGGASRSSNSGTPGKRSPIPTPTQPASVKGGGKFMDEPARSSTGGRGSALSPGVGGGTAFDNATVSPGVGTNNSTTTSHGGGGGWEGFEPMQSREEELEDTKAQLRMVMFELASSGLTRPRKNLVEAKLKEKNPIRFANQDVRFLAIHEATDPKWGFLTEEKEGKGTVLVLKTEAFLPPELRQ